jgi:hypothetical protein
MNYQSESCTQVMLLVALEYGTLSTNCGL